MITPKDDVSQQFVDLPNRLARREFFADCRGRGLAEFEADAAIGYWYAVETYTDDCESFPVHAGRHIMREFRATDRRADHLPESVRRSVKADELDAIAQPVSLLPGDAKPVLPDSPLFEFKDWLDAHFPGDDSELMKLILIADMSVVEAASVLGMDYEHAKHCYRRVKDEIAEKGRDWALEVLS